MDQHPPRFRIVMDDHLFSDGKRGVWVVLNEVLPDGEFTRAYVYGEYATVQTTYSGILVMVDGRQRIVGDEMDDRTVRSKGCVEYWKDEDRGGHHPHYEFRNHAGRSERSGMGGPYTFHRESGVLNTPQAFHHP